MIAAVGKAKAMDLCLTARFMDAAEAEQSGLVARVIPADQLLEETLRAAAGETHEHGHGAGEVQKLRLDAGRKWATDAPLRQAMDEINRALAQALPLIHTKHFDDAQYRALAATVNRHVAFAVDNCHLEPKADAMLHLVIADLVAGAGAMQGASGRPPQDGATQVVKALQAYGKYFQHPGWQAPRG